MEEIAITRFGQPIAEIIAPRRAWTARRPLGDMAGTVRVLGDIVGPVFDESGSNAARAWRSSPPHPPTPSPRKAPLARKRSRTARVR